MFSKVTNHLNVSKPFGERISLDYKFKQGGNYLEQNVEIVKVKEGRSVVIIRDIRFKGKRNIDWNAVEDYVKEYIGNCYEILETSDKVFIGKEFPGEIKGSVDTKRLYGANARAKANATQKIPYLLECASNKRWTENYKEKHNMDAKYGWYRYTSRFALPTYSEDEAIKGYIVYRIEMLIRHASDNKLYLYDMVNIKKETKYPT